MNTRRNFIKQTLAGSALISLSGAVPPYWLGASRAALLQSDEKILVVVQLSGGNDGLNTVIPHGFDEYYQNRFTLAVNQQNVLKINDQIGFHPALVDFQRLQDDGQLTIIQGVGYANPNRSHFESMDLWHTAHRTDRVRQLGWLGRTVEQAWNNSDLPALHLGEGLQPLALRTDQKPIPSVRSLQEFQLHVLANEEASTLLEPLLKSAPHPKNQLLSYLHDSSQIARATSHRLDGIAPVADGRFGYPDSNLGRNLNVIAQLIESGLSTRIYYVTLDGFDTHSNQGPAHQGLLSDLGSSLGAFMKQLTQQNNQQRVAVLSFSEFGRRVRENASAGTDHGAAAPVFLLSGAVSQQIVGDHPDLQDLDEGDLKFKIDYRQIYADVLQNWLQVDSDAVLGNRFEPLGLFV